VLLAAIVDWPNSVTRVEDYEREVHQFVGGEVTKRTIKECLSKIDHSINAWQAESLTQLIDVFEYYGQDVSLKEVIIDLRLKLDADSI
jgi:hypothetical protein